MFDVLQALTLSFGITFLAIPVIIRVADMKKLYDVPDERKVHHTPIPSLGGLGLFAGFSLALLFSTNFTEAPGMQYYLAAGLVIFFLGIKDDILVLTPIKKFIGQVLAAFIIIYHGHVQLNSMHGFLGINELPETFSLLLTYFAVIVIVNSFNLIDGVDGLAGSLGLLSTSILGVYFFYIGHTPDAILAFSVVGSLLAFLIFNFQPARIFMGDTGSLLIGMANAVLVIKFINAASSPVNPFRLDAAVAIGFAFLMIPLLDTLRVFAIRIINRRSPFSPDRNHIHHLLLDRGWSHKEITISLVLLNALFVGAVFAARQFGCTWLIMAMVVVFFGIIGLLYLTSSKPRLFVAKADMANASGKGKTRIVPLTKDSVLEQK